MGSSASKQATILINLTRRLKVRKVTTSFHLTKSEKMIWQVLPQIDGLRWNSERRESHRLVLPNNKQSWHFVSKHFGESVTDKPTQISHELE